MSQKILKSNNIEKNSKGFDLNKLKEAQKKTIEVVHKVSTLVTPGINESEGEQIIDKVLLEFGAEKKWHPNKFRIGKNTLKSFREPSEEIYLSENDIYFIDIGPVFDGYEGDYGQTFSTGTQEKYLNIIKSCKQIFNEVANEFNTSNMTGKELYQYAEKISEKHGHILNLNMTGHRLGDFPHALYFKGKLGDLDFTPQNNHWVLEILIRHPELPFGAFYENLI